MAEALAATSAQRPTLNRPEVMEKLTSTSWLRRVIALRGLLGLVSKMSLAMQKVNVVPWELMDEQREFHDILVLMEAALRDRPKDTGHDGAQYPRVLFLRLYSLSFTRSRILRIIMGSRELQCFWQGLT